MTSAARLVLMSKPQIHGGVSPGMRARICAVRLEGAHEASNGRSAIVERRCSELPHSSRTGRFQGDLDALQYLRSTHFRQHDRVIR
jgi:hypothetical protein